MDFDRLDSLEALAELSIDDAVMPQVDAPVLRELVKMARRYLWLRDESVAAEYESPTVSMPWIDGYGKKRERLLEGQALDDAIDAVMEEGK